jgi:hypothetical protein
MQSLLFTWLATTCAFARGEQLLAAALYRAIGSLPNEAHARLTAGGAACTTDSSP